MRGIGLLLILLGLTAGPLALAWAWDYFSPRKIEARKHRKIAREEQHRKIAREERELRQIERDLGLRED